MLGARRRGGWHLTPVHLHEAHHTPAFWRLVERAMPDYPARKQWLAENGRDLVAV